MENPFSGGSYTEAEHAQGRTQHISLTITSQALQPSIKLKNSIYLLLSGVCTHFLFNKKKSIWYL